VNVKTDGLKIRPSQRAAREAVEATKPIGVTVKVGLAGPLTYVAMGRFKEMQIGGLGTPVEAKFTC